MLLPRGLGDVCCYWGWKRMKLKRTGDTEAFQDKAARQTKSFLNHYLSFKALTWLFLNVSVQVCVCLWDAYRAGWGQRPPHSSTRWKRCGWLRQGSQGVWWARRNRVHRGSRTHTEARPALRRKRGLGCSDSMCTGNSSIAPDPKPPVQPRKSLPGPRSSTQPAPRSPAAALSEADPRPQCSPDWWILDSISVRLCRWECLPERPGLEGRRSFPWRRPNCVLWW